MPKALVAKLPESAKKIYESAWDSAKEKGWDVARCAAYAIGAVKRAGFRKSASGNWVKMTEPIAVVFSEPIVGSGWIEAACTGTVVDMNGNNVSISDDDLEDWIHAYEEDARGQELPITWDHPKTGGKAAGWIRGVRKGATRLIRGKPRTTLLIRPEWTPDGDKSIGDKTYQYISLEIMPNNVLRGASLVNFPAVKGLRPVTQAAALAEYCLQEFMDERQGVLTMAEKAQKCPKCGATIPAGTDVCPACGYELTPEEIAPEKAPKKVPAKTAPPPKEKQVMSELAVAQLQEQEQLVIRLQERVAEIEAQYKTAVQNAKDLSEARDTQGQQINTLIELNNMMRLHEKVTDFMELEEHPDKSIAPAYEEKIIEVLLAAPEKESELLSLIESVATGDAVVPMGELGTGSVPELQSEDPNMEHAHEKIVKFAEQHEIDYKAALLQLSKEGKI